MDKRDEAIGGIVFFLFGMAVIIMSLQLSIGTFRVAGTGLFPLCLGILLMILSGIFILNLFFHREAGGGKKAPPPEITGSAKRVILFLGAVALATALLNPLGYLLTSFLLLLSLLGLLGMTRWIPRLLISLIAAGASYLLFVSWLKIPLPKGWPGI
ncbi:MAG: tripartite tricarboxylate transporter TctB family protein [Smithellaceae bacterium]|nr:tripartite tricarboxylate transporter TctB family protein [Smithellaceae bacterium]